MAKIFAITTGTEDIKAGADGKAGVVFKVVNSSNKPARGIATVKPFGNTQQDWLSIEGEIERDFSANGDQSFTVTFNKPPVAGQASEKFPFRFDVASAENPDEVFTEGPQVKVETRAVPLVEKKKPFPWWILIVIGGVAVLAGLVVLVIFLTRSPAPREIVEVKNLYDYAAVAAWRSSNGDSLPYNGSDGDSRGFVKPRDGATMENGVPAQKILETHPLWANGGGISGTYQLDRPIKDGDKFRATIGFLQGAGAGNLRLRVRLNNNVVEELPKQYDGVLKEWAIDLSQFKGQSGTLTLEAIATPTSAQGWICWINPRIMNEP